ncbi:MAG: zinc ribbon domain-containing protein [Candidatus Peribacter sp.]|nr:zinc ribbon domain-containing protein [Candidatus Peribacter sp.]
MSMFCPQCGKEVPGDSLFCTYCGELIKDPIDEKKKQEKTKADSNNEESKMTLFDKFAEIHDSTGDQREKYNALISPAAWTIMNSLANNDLEKILSKHEELKQESYAFVKALLFALQLSYPGGYRLYLANRLLYKQKLSVFEHVPSEEELRKELQKIDFNIEYAKIGMDARMIMDNYCSFRVTSLFESYPEHQKRLDTKAVEALKAEVLGGIIWGYFLAQIEDRYRK